MIIAEVNKEYSWREREKVTNKALEWKYVLPKFLRMRVNE